MAKSFTMAADKKKGYNYPSRFGSHSSMINNDKTVEGSLSVTLTDEYGDYVTDRDRLDTGLADPNRYATSRLDKLFSRTEKK